MQTTATRIPTGTRVTAQNPGGLACEGTLIGYTPEGFAEVEWFGPWMLKGQVRHVGRFTQVTPL